LPISRIISEHHERIDGSGYPRGLRGEEILLESRIVAVADVYDVVRHRRAYHPAQGQQKALEILSAGAGKSSMPTWSTRSCGSSTAGSTCQRTTHPLEGPEGGTSEPDGGYS
jgi:hypothetical protein